LSFLNRFMEAAPVDDTLRSVIRNLLYLLNSRPGYGSQLREFGLGDYLAQQGKRATQWTVLREIQDGIAAYEPRLQVQELSTGGRDAELWLLIHLRGKLLLRSGVRSCLLRLRFHLPSGAVQVESDEVKEGLYGA
jgi:predicted component of type VI protein secretion system